MMACGSQALVNNVISANGGSIFNPSPTFFCTRHHPAALKTHSAKLFTVRASAADPDCNEEECAPDKEVGKVSVEWLAGDKTRVVGTFPPKKKGWTGYVEKDTAGQTNIYSVEPTVYIAESAISSGTAGSSSDGAENTAALVAGLGLIFVAAASSILLQVGRNEPQVQTLNPYSGPSLSYYIDKFKPPEIVQTSAVAAEEEQTLSSSTPDELDSPEPEAEAEAASEEAST